jgi:hypothetical protein
MAHPSTHAHRDGQVGEIARDLATGLGWFSIALGAAEIHAPGVLTRALGMGGQEKLVQAYGLREVATGIGILSSADPAPWMWGRVAGDALDMATVATALRDDNPQRRNVALSLAALAGVTALDAACARALSLQGGGEREPVFYDYSDRSGFHSSPEAMRGAAGDFEAPPEFMIPEPLRPYTSAKRRVQPVSAISQAETGAAQPALSS